MMPMNRQALLDKTASKLARYENSAKNAVFDVDKDYFRDEAEYYKEMMKLLKQIDDSLKEGK